MNIARKAHLLPHCVVTTALLALVVAGAAWAMGLRLGNFVLDSQEGSVAVRFSLGLSEPRELQSVLDQGAALVLSAEAMLSKVYSYWPDQTLNRSELDIFLRREPEASDYVMIFSDGRPSLRDASLPDLLRRGWALVSMPIGDFSMLEKNGRYRVDFSATLTQAETPAWKRWSPFTEVFESPPELLYQMVFVF